jgi:hypothetical protein
VWFSKNCPKYRIAQLAKIRPIWSPRSETKKSLKQKLFPNFQVHSDRSPRRAVFDGVLRAAARVRSRAGHPGARRAAGQSRVESQTRPSAGPLAAKRCEQFLQVRAPPVYINLELGPILLISFGRNLRTM